MNKPGFEVKVHDCLGERETFAISQCLTLHNESIAETASMQTSSISATESEVNLETVEIDP